MSLSRLSRQQLSDLDRLLRAEKFVGRFIDPFAPRRSSWPATSIALYFAWWSFRPEHCRNCGQKDGWFPSQDDEYCCSHCSAGNGSTKSNEIVEDIGGENDGPDDDGDDEDGGDLAATQFGAVGETGAVPAMEYYLSVLMHLRTLPAAKLVVLDVTYYPRIFRTAMNVALLFLLPDMDSDTSAIVRAASLFVAASLVVPSVVPFPLFQQCARCAVEWLDVEHISGGIGLSPLSNDFFSAPEAHMRNLMVSCLGSNRPPSITWDITRGGEERRTYVAALAQKRLESLSPDHTAAIVAMELMRRYEAENTGDDDSAGGDGTTRLVEWRERVLAASPNRGEVLVDGSPSTAALLVVLAEAFAMPPLALAEMLGRSGLYRGRTRFSAQLKSRMSVGRYSLPLYRRRSPAESPWACVHRALHSDDRLVLLQVLHVLSATGATAERVRMLPDVTALLRAILRRHGSSSRLLFYYCFRMIDGTDRQMRGVYFCTSVDSRAATYTHLSGTKTIAFHASTQQVVLTRLQGLGDDGSMVNGLGGGGGGIGGAAAVVADGVEQRVVSGIGLQMTAPALVAVEGAAAQLLLNAVAFGERLEHWTEAAQRLDAQLVVKRAMLAAASDAERFALLADVRSYWHGAAGGGNGGGSDVGDRALLVTPLPAVTADAVAASFAELLDVLHPTFAFGLTDAQVVRRACELQFLHEAGHPLVEGIACLTATSRPVQALLGTKRSAAVALDGGAVASSSLGRKRVCLETAHTHRRALHDVLAFVAAGGAANGAAAGNGARA